MKPRSSLVQKRQCEYPTPSEDLAKKFLGYADLDPEAYGEIMRMAIAKQVELLDAHKKTYFAFEGVVMDERTDADHAIQLKAATELIQIGMDAMGLKKRPGGNEPTKPIVNIDLSGWAVTAPTPTPTSETLTP